MPAISPISELVASIGVLILAGILVSSYSFRFRMPDVLLLMLVGIFFGSVKYYGTPLLSFPLFFLAFISIFSLCILFFDASSIFRWRFFHTFSLRTLFLVLSFSILLLFFYSLFTRLLLGVSWAPAVMLSLIMAGTAPEFLFQIVGVSKSRIVQVLRFESLFSSLVVLIPVVILFFYTPSGASMDSFVLNVISRIVLSSGVGIVLAILLWKVLNTFYSLEYRSSVLLCASILSYIIAEVLGGVGIVGVVAFGIFFGNVYLKRDFSIIGFPSTFGRFLYILLFGLIGIVTPVFFSPTFFVVSLLLFFAHLLLRFLAVLIVRRMFNFSIGEVLFISGTAPKGGAVASAIFAIAIFSDFSGIPDISVILPFMVVLFSYSLLFSLFSVYISKKFLGVDVKESE